MNKLKNFLYNAKIVLLGVKDSWSLYWEWRAYMKERVN